jgi:hypothetical protein
MNVSACRSLRQCNGHRRIHHRFKKLLCSAAALSSQAASLRSIFIVSVPYLCGMRNAMRRFIFTAICIAAATAANAHDWYEDKFDPQMKYKCCDGTDCRAIPRSSVRSRVDGGYTYLPHNFIIPRDRVQESPDDQYHICESTYVVTNQLYLRCFFAPGVKISVR